MPHDRAGATGGWRPVPSGFTHKRAADEILVDAARLVDEACTDFRLRTPTAHGRYRTAGPLDSMLVAEWTRQAITATAHLRFDVPLDWAFVMRRMRVEVLSSSQRVGDVVGTVEVSDAVLKGDRLRSLEADILFCKGGEPAARGFGDLQVLEPAVYRRIRADASSSDELPSRAPGTAAIVVTANPRSGWRIDYDPHDRFFFDHPLDHVPGMVVFAALRSIAIEHLDAARGDLVIFDGVFHRYAELRARLQARVRRVVRVSGRTLLDVDVLDADGQLLVTAALIVAGGVSPLRARS